MAPNGHTTQQPRRTRHAPSRSLTTPTQNPASAPPASPLPHRPIPRRRLHLPAGQLACGLMSLTGSEPYTGIQVMSLTGTSSSPFHLRAGQLVDDGAQREQRAVDVRTLQPLALAGHGTGRLGARQVDERQHRRTAAPPRGRLAGGGLGPGLGPGRGGGGCGGRHLHDQAREGVRAAGVLVEGGAADLGAGRRGPSGWERAAASKAERDWGSAGWGGVGHAIRFKGRAGEGCLALRPTVRMLCASSVL
jgi:hypothetical protein